MNLRTIAVATTVTLLISAFMIYRVRGAIGGSNIVQSPTTMPSTQPTAMTAGPLNYTMKDIDGHDVNLADYRGKVVMIVNVASRCGFTPQYQGLEDLYKTYSDRGFVILGFPANNFNHQEPGDDAEIKTFCSSKYMVTFPMMSKISVAGDDQAPLYALLTGPQNGAFAGPIGWNFTKFLVDRNGQVYARFPSKTKPSDKVVTDAIEAGLGAQ